MNIAFVLLILITSIGCYVAFALVDLGESGPAIAAALTASYTGGSINFVATAQAVGLEGSMFITAKSADTLGSVVFLTLLMLLPASSLVRKLMPSRFIDQDGRSLGEPVSHEESQSEPFSLFKAVNGVALSLLICAVGKTAVTMAGYDHLFILTITVLVLLVANLGKPLLRYVAFEFELGTFFMFVFFAAIGAGANLAEVAAAALSAALFIITLVLVHLTLFVVVGSLLKLDLAEALVASNACILGPPTAVALAAGRGWRELVTPGMLVGILGYSIGTFIGVAIYQSPS